MGSQKLGALGLGLLFGLGAPGAVADDFADLPPPPGDESTLSIDSDFAEVPYEDLPPVPGLDSPMQSAELDQSLGDSLLPPSEPEFASDDAFLPPALADEPLSTDTDSESFSDFAPESLPVVPETFQAPPASPSFAGSSNEPSLFSSGKELSDLSMGDRVKTKDLVLWLNFGPSYSKLNTKGKYAALASAVPAFSEDLGGLGYNIGLGFMMGSWLQGQLDFTGTPYTRSSTVDHAMFGFGPRLGFISLMALVGAQRGVDMSSANSFNAQSKSRLLSYGVKGGLDLVLSHKKNSRVSYGLAPEVFYITSQQSSGYTNVGAAVSLRIYGYESPF